MVQLLAYTFYKCFTFNMNNQDVDDMLRQMRTCILDRINYYALFVTVLLMLFWHYSEVFIPHFTVIIYGLYTKNLHLISYVWPLINNAYRCVLSLSWRFSASAMYATFGIQKFEAVIRNSTFGFIQRLAKSTNCLIMAIESLWIVRIDIGNF